MYMLSVESDLPVKKIIKMLCKLFVIQYPDYPSDAVIDVVLDTSASCREYGKTAACRFHGSYRLTFLNGCHDERIGSLVQSGDILTRNRRDHLRAAAYRRSFHFLNEFIDALTVALVRSVTCDYHLERLNRNALKILHGLKEQIVILIE